MFYFPICQIRIQHGPRPEGGPWSGVVEEGKVAGLYQRRCQVPEEGSGAGFRISEMRIVIVIINNTLKTWLNTDKRLVLPKGTFTLEVL
jgi:hypothetical protein